jgi:two-component system nitrate/nitrite response regulator NarL
MPSSELQRTLCEHQRVIVGSAGISADVRAVLMSVCARHPTFAFCGHTSSRGVLQRDLLQKRPDIVLMDDAWLSDRRLSVLGRLHRALPATRTILIGSSLGLETISRALRLGTWGVIAETRAAVELEPALRAVARGEFWLSRRQLSRLLMLAAPDPQHYFPELTPRENAVMRGVLSGYQNKQIARMLDIAEHTLKVHLHHVYVKLHLHGRIELLLRYGRLPLVSRPGSTFLTAWAAGCVCCLI